MALCVIILGAYVRLSDAGLGCPDWPGCYGHLLGVPVTTDEINRANEFYPQPVVETDKAWKEMVHRYLAGGFGILVLFIGIVAGLNRHDLRQPFVLPLALLVITIFQGLLGMWTVTLLLNPIIVSMHLLGGMAILAILWWLILTSIPNQATQAFTGANKDFKLAIFVTAILVMQIFLGAWTSSNYAALACTDFPTCQQKWLPDAIDFGSIFSGWYNQGFSHEFGTLESPARTAIHWLHRLGALIIAILIIGFLLRLLVKKPPASVKMAAGAGFFLLIAQIALGISNVVYSLPIAVAIAHNGTAALLLLAMITMIYRLKSCVTPEIRS